MKPKIAVYVTGDVAARLAMAAKRPGTSKSKIVNDALDRFLDPARDQHLVATIVEGQRDLSQEVRHLHRDLDIVAESPCALAALFPDGHAAPSRRRPGTCAADRPPAVRRVHSRDRKAQAFRQAVLDTDREAGGQGGLGSTPGAVSPRPPPEGKPDQATDGATRGKDDATKNGG